MRGLEKCAGGVEKMPGRGGNGTPPFEEKGWGDPKIRKQD